MLRLKQGESMTYQQAGRIAVLKRIVGWVIFIPALLSTLISVLKYMYVFSEKQEGINLVILDFIHVMIEMVRFNTPTLNVFWENSPQIDFQQSPMVAFWAIFALIFIGLALKDSGARMSRQVKYIRESVQDQLILEQAKGEVGLSKQQLDAKIDVPNHSFLGQIFPLYILPITVLVIGYLFLHLLDLV